MYLIVGLGNPGAKYLFTRHNIGFLSVDHFSIGCNKPPHKEEFHAITQKFKLDDVDVLLAKPQSYMNCSGEPVQAIMSFYKIEIENLLVVHDDIDQPFSQLRFHKNRSAGGHNGIKDLIEKLGTQDFARLKLGVGKPTIAGMEVADYVLQKFNKEEESAVPDFLSTASDAIESFIFEGLEKSANRFNQKSADMIK